MTRFSVPAVGLTLAALLALAAPPATAQQARRGVAPLLPHSAALRPGQLAEMDADVMGLPGRRPARTAAIVPLRTIQYNWANNGWQNPTRITYTYDAGARVTLQETADSVSGAPFYRTFYTYDAQGHEIESRDEQYTGSGWENQNRRLSVYNTRSHTIEYRSQSWQNNAWTTSYGNQYDYTYDAAGLVTQYVRRRYATSSGTFVNFGRRTSTYAGGQWSVRLDEFWDATAGTWVIIWRYVSPVWGPAPTNYLLGYHRQEWVNGTFVDGLRSTATYGANYSSVWLDEKPTGPGGAWQNAYRYTDNFDSYNNWTDYQNESWDLATSNWSIDYGGRNARTYGPGGEQLREVYQQYDQTAGQYLYTQRLNHGNFLNIPTGLPAEAAAAPVALYPNPTAGPLWLNAPTATAATVRDGLGRVVLTRALAADDARLDLSALPAGVYSVRLQTPTGPVVRRVVKQ